MQTSVYNNPLFASSIGKMISSFVGNPENAARDELLASEALLNNQTAQYRDAIGETGMSGDLASMMIRSLQAGPDYARVAPTIGNNALKFGSLGFGSPELTPTGGAADLILSAMTPRSGGRRSAGGGRSAGGSSGGAKAPREITQSELTRLARIVKAANYEGAEAAEVQAGVIEAYRSGDFGTLDEAAAAILPGITRSEPVIGDPNELFDGQGSVWNDIFKGPEVLEEGGALVIPEVGQPKAPPNDEAAKVIEDAKMAISRGASREAVAERLRSMGIDPKRAGL